MNRDECVRTAYNIPGFCWPRELGWLFDTFAESKAHAEVGVFCGKSLFASCGGMQKARVYAVEPFASDTGVAAAWQRRVLAATIEEIAGVTVHLLEMTSLSAALGIFGKVTLDSVYIDADHHYAECLADIQAWLPLVRPGGLIAGHDYWPQDPGVMDAVNEAFEGDFAVVPDTRIWWHRKPG